MGSPGCKSRILIATHLTNNVEFEAELAVKAHRFFRTKTDVLVVLYAGAEWDSLALSSSLALSGAVWR